MIHLAKRLEHALTLALIGMLAVVVLLATLELGVTIARDIATPPILFPGIDRLLDLFGKFLLVLIGIELLETIRAFADKGIVRTEIVLTVALIALARKIIVLEPDHVSATAMLGIAALIAAVSLAYRVFVHSRRGESGA